MRLIRAALLLGVLLLPGAAARDLTPTERQAVAAQVLTWPAGTLPELPHLARAELGQYDSWLAALRSLPVQTQRDAVLLSMPILARQGAVEVARRALALVEGGDRVRVWAVSALMFLQEQGSDAAVRLLSGLGTPVEQVQALAILTQVAQTSPVPKDDLRRVADATWAAYRRLSPGERTRVAQLVLPTVAMTGDLSRARQLIQGSGAGAQRDWLSVAEALASNGSPDAARQALAQFPLERAEEVVRIRGALLLVKLGQAGRAFQVAVQSPLPGPMQAHLARELASAGHVPEAARLARTLSPVSLRAQTLTEIAVILGGQGQRAVALRLAQEARADLNASASPESTANVVYALAFLGEEQAAGELIRGWKGSDPQGPDRLHAALVRGLAERGEVGEAIRRVRSRPSLPALYALVGRAEARAQQGKAEEARTLLLAALELSDRFPAEARMVVLSTLARVSPSTLESLAARGPLPGEAWLAVVEAQARRGDVAAARASLAHLPAEQRQQGAFNLAQGLVEGGHADLALPLLQDPALREAVARVLLGEERSPERTAPVR